MRRPDPTPAAVFAQVLLNALTSWERAEDALQANRASAFCLCGGPKAGSRDYMQPAEEFCRACTRLLDGEQRKGLQDQTGEQYLRTMVAAVRSITARRAEKGGTRSKASSSPRDRRAPVVAGRHSVAESL